MATLEKTTELWTSISVWVAASELGWTGYVYAGLNYQHLQLMSFSWKSIPTFEFGRVSIYFEPWKACCMGKIEASLVRRGHKWLD
ncbi:unnamed protein product [Prunus armeniaca]